MYIYIWYLMCFTLGDSPVASSCLWFLVLSQDFGLLLGQWDKWVPCLADDRSKWFCFEEELLTVSLTAAVDNSVTGCFQQLLLSELMVVELLLPALSQHRLEIVLRRCQSDFAWQLLLSVHTCLSHGSTPRMRCRQCCLRYHFWSS